MRVWRIKYDEHGEFYIFLFAVYTVVFVACQAIYWLFHKKVEAPKYFIRCPCRACSEKHKQQSWYKGVSGQKVLWVIMWVVFLTLGYMAYQSAGNIAEFDPYAELQVASDASMTEIKRAYRRLVRMKHPDMREGDEKQFLRLKKAYEVLTNEAAKNNWLQYGRPEGPQPVSIGFAVPEWFMDELRTPWVFFLFVTLTVFAFPTLGMYYAGNYLLGNSGNQKKCKIDSYMLGRVQPTFEDQILFICDTLANDEQLQMKVDLGETQSTYLQELQLKSLPQNLHLKDIKTKHAVLLVYAYLNRVDLQHRHLMKLQEKLVEALLEALSDIPHNSLQTRAVVTAVKSSQLLCQALLDGKETTMHQLPHITEHIISSIDNITSQRMSLERLVSMSDALRRKVLRDLSDPEYNDLLQACSVFPKVTLSVKPTVLSSTLTGGYQIHLSVTVVREPLLVSQEAAAAAAETSRTSSSSAEKPLSGVIPHCPRLPGGGDRREGWWLLVTDAIEGRLLASPRHIHAPALHYSHCVGVTCCTLPPSSSNSSSSSSNRSLVVQLMSDCYVGSDQTLTVSV